MNTEIAFFQLRDRDGPMQFYFFYEGGKPQTIDVISRDTMTGLDNRKGLYKPCVTHCKELARHHLGDETKREERRRKAVKPALAIDELETKREERRRKAVKPALAIDELETKREERRPALAIYDPES